MTGVVSSMTVTSPATTGLRDLCEVRFAGAGLVLAVVVAGCRVVGAGAALATAVVGLCCLVLCLALPLRLAVVVGLTAWALVTGFVSNELGVLTFRDADLLRLGALLVLAVVGAAVGAGPQPPAPRLRLAPSSARLPSPPRARRDPSSGGPSR